MYLHVHRLFQVYTCCDNGNVYIYIIQYSIPLDCEHN